MWKYQLFPDEQHTSALYNIQAPIRALGSSAPQWLVDIAKDIALTEIETLTTAKKSNFELVFKTVGHGMPLDIVPSHINTFVFLFLIPLRSM